MVGRLSSIALEPLHEDHTTWFGEGSLTVGLEYRRLRAANLKATFGSAATYRQRAAGLGQDEVLDQGWSLHVLSRTSGHEYLRFDLFDLLPHYHYNRWTGRPDQVVNNVVDYDRDANGPVGPWVMRCVRDRLPAMLAAAGAFDSEPTLDRTLPAAVVSRLQAEVDRAIS